MASQLLLEVAADVGRVLVFLGTTYRGTQFPFTIAYAITAHKSQGATLDKAVLDISEREFQPGLTYVAVRRVKTIEGLMFDCPFDLSALRVQANTNHAARAEDIARRLPQHVAAA